MRHVSVPSFDNKDTYTTAYSEFLGCAFLPDESKVGDSYSPDCLNMMPDAIGFPQKRIGWRTLLQFDEPVYGIHKFQTDGKTYILLHVGHCLYCYDPSDDTYFNTCRNMASARSVSIPYGGKLYLLDGSSYLCFDGKRTRAVGDSADGSLDGCTAFIPTTSILCRPTGGGETYQKYNMLTAWRRNTFTTDGDAVRFTVDTGRIDKGTPVYVKDLETNEAVDSSIVFIDPDSGSVLFDVAPSAPAISGTQKIEITFRCTPEESYADIIPQCSIGCLYGYDAANRMFLSGNPQHKNKLFYSENNDPTYFADLNYIEIGVSNFRIMSFLKTHAGELAVLKEHNDAEATIWHVSAEISGEDGMAGTYFPVREGVSGCGAMSPYASAQLKNDSLFLGLFGIYNLATNYSNAKYLSAITSRSSAVDFRLQQDGNFSTAHAVVWDNKYLLFVKGHVYVMTTDRNWFFWDNVPAMCSCACDDLLLFGTADGRFCRFNTDRKTTENRYRMDAYNDDGAPILARWSTKISSDGDFFRTKSLSKSGFGVYLTPHPRTSCTVYVKPLDGAKRFVKDVTKRSFDFNDVDFNDFDFESSPNFLCPIRARLRSYNGLQIVVENDKLNEAFGLSQIIYRYCFTGYARR